MRNLTEQQDDDQIARGDATPEPVALVEMLIDDDPGGDPYNRTGRFERLVR